MFRVVYQEQLIEAGLGTGKVKSEDALTNF